MKQRLNRNISTGCTGSFGGVGSGFLGVYGLDLALINSFARFSNAAALAL